MTLNLSQGTHSPYNKPNNTPQYVHSLSNHPPAVLKSIPEGVNKRLSSLSSNQEIFEKTAPQFQEALARSGYKHKLKFTPHNEDAPTKRKNRCRKRNVLWFNPPFNSSVKTNVGQEFLKLVDKCFPPSNPLSRIFNRKTVKVSYSTTNNMQGIISSKNAKILNRKERPLKNCNCREDTSCPLEGKCLDKNVVYKATVTQQDGTQNNYVGLASTEFKARFAVHKTSFKDSEKCQTSLSKHIHELKSQNIDHSVTWKTIDRGAPFSPVSNVCNLCTKEKYQILFSKTPLLNSRNEIYSHCRHKQSVLLIPKVRKKKKSPG